MKVTLMMGIIFFILGGSSSAQNLEYIFNCRDTDLKGSIKYSVIGNYRAGFKECDGSLSFDPVDNKITKVFLKIKLASIQSNCGWCDKIVLSKRLLDAEKYPFVTFQGQEFINEKNQDFVVGTIQAHGIEKVYKLPFSFEKSQDAQGQISGLNAKGKWMIKRKDFDITWNRLLDKGGVLVGDHIVLEWRIRARKE